MGLAICQSHHIVDAICKALDISLNRFMAYKPLRSPEIILNGSFRKSDNLSSLQEQKIIAQIQYALERYLEVADIIGTGCIGVVDTFESLFYTKEHEKCAGAMRKLLGFSERGAISNLVQVLEDANIFVVQINVEDTDFSGYSCWYNRIPIIAYNGTMSIERQRFTIAHELVHLLFEKELKLSEKEIDDIAGRFLLPTEDCRRELGVKRKKLSTVDLCFICEEYGVSSACVAYRVKQSIRTSVCFLCASGEFFALKNQICRKPQASCKSSVIFSRLYNGINPCSCISAKFIPFNVFSKVSHVYLYSSFLSSSLYTRSERKQMRKCAFLNLSCLHLDIVEFLRFHHLL